jgi:hypothetical protein
MRISEIITESLDEQTLDEWSHTDDEIINILKKKGYKLLGKGVDQTAFIEPSTSYVLKIFGTNSTENFSKDQKMFFRWTKFCMKHQDNPFLPRFYGYAPFDFKGHRYLQIRTEQLYKGGNIAHAVGQLADFISQYEDISEVLHKFETYRPLSNDLLWKKLQNLGNIYLLAETLKKLYDKGSKREYLWDMHSDNIMVRKDGTPVINDPWVVE